MISVVELFKIGVGPSSSHTVGPMKAAAAFARGLVESGAIERVASLEVALLGSLAFTGKGHATDKAVILGLSGETPEHVDLDAAEALVMAVRETKTLNLARRRAIAFRRRARHSLRHCDARAAPSQHHALRRARRGGRSARRRDLALGRRRVHHPRRRRRQTRRRPNLSFPIRSARGPSFWRAGAKPSCRSPSSCGPTKRRCGPQARRTLMPGASSR